MVANGSVDVYVSIMRHVTHDVNNNLQRGLKKGVGLPVGFGPVWNTVLGWGDSCVIQICVF